MKFVIGMEQCDDGSWSVIVPDLPGCYSWGRTREEAARNAGEAIDGHIEVMREFGEPIPEGFDGAITVEMLDLARSDTGTV